MSTRNNNKRYNNDFKKMIVNLYHSGGSVKDLSGEYGVSSITSISGLRIYPRLKGLATRGLLQKMWMPFKKKTFF